MYCLIAVFTSPFLDMHTHAHMPSTATDFHSRIEVVVLIRSSVRYRAPTLPGQKPQSHNRTRNERYSHDWLALGFSTPACALSCSASGSTKGQRSSSASTPFLLPVMPMI